MTSSPFALNGHELRALTLRVGNVGPWIADVELVEAPAVSGVVTLTVGELRLRGTVVEVQAGAFALARRMHVVGGAGGWGKRLAPRAYHNDAGVKARLVAEDAARDAGELLGRFEPAAPSVGRDFVRDAVLASSVLERAAGGVPWFVDYDGTTHVAARPAVPVAPAAYELLGFDGRTQLALLAADELSKLPIGGVLRDDKRLDAPQTIRDLELVAERGKPPRVIAWCGGADTSASRLAELLRAIAQRATDGQLFGVYRYRVVSEAADSRCDLQAVRKAAGLPDIRTVSQWPGVAGMYQSLAHGAEVLVQFVEGDRAQPVIVAYAGKDGTGFAPTSTTLGGDTGLPAARQGDPVEVMLPPAQFSGTITLPSGPAPATGVVSWVLPKAEGVITGGSGKVSIAT